MNREGLGPKKDSGAVLLDFGISQEAVDSHLKLLAQIGAKEQLKSPSVDVPQHDLLSRGFSTIDAHYAEGSTG